MKYLIYLFLILSVNSYAQRTSSNRPELAKTILDSYVEMSESRGIEVRQRLYTIDTIIFLENYENTHEHKDGKCIIHIDIKKYQSDAEIMRSTFHEIGHHMDLRHCIKCSYNIMAEIQDGRATRLFNIKPIQQLYLDIYFEAIRDPKKYNIGHTHY